MEAWQRHQRHKKEDISQVAKQLANHVQTEQYEDANILIAQIEDYFAQRGGTCTRSDEIGTGKSK